MHNIVYLSDLLAQVLNTHIEISTVPNSSQKIIYLQSCRSKLNQTKFLIISYSSKYVILFE